MISRFLFRSIFPLTGVLLLVAGCASTPYQQSSYMRDESVPPQGSTLVLQQPLELPSDKARVFLQHGRIIRFQDRDRFEPVCSFGLRREGDEPLIRTIEPDRFTIGPARSRANARAEPMPRILLASRRTIPGLLHLSTGMPDRGGGLGYLSFSIEIPLQSDIQPQVDNLICTIDRPAYWRGRVGVGAIRDALGDIAAIRPAE